MKNYTTNNSKYTVLTTTPKHQVLFILLKYIELISNM